jgi:hypothetical protein
VIVEAELLSSNEEAIADEDEDLEASLMSSDSGVFRYYTRRSGVQPPNHDYDSRHVLLTPGYNPGSKPSSHSYNSRDPSHNYHDSHTPGRSYSESHPPGKPGSYHGPEHDKYDHRYDVKSEHKHDDKFAHIHEEKRDDVVQHHTGERVTDCPLGEGLCPRNNLALHTAQIQRPGVCRPEGAINMTNAGLTFQ